MDHTRGVLPSGSSDLELQAVYCCEHSQRRQNRNVYRMNTMELEERQR